MSVDFYMDEHVQSAITAGLRARGVNVLTVQEDGREGYDDPELLDRAGQLVRALFTRDADFLAEAARRQRRGIELTGVIYAHQDLPIGRCIADLELIAVAADLEEIADQVTYLPLR